MRAVTFLHAIRYLIVASGWFICGTDARTCAEEPPLLRVYRVVPGSAEAYANFFKKQYEKSPTVWVSGVVSDFLCVYASDREQDEIASVLGIGPVFGRSKVGPVTKVVHVPCKANVVVELLSKMFPDTKAGRLYIKNFDEGSILIKGPKPIVAELEAAIQALVGDVEAVPVSK